MFVDQVKVEAIAGKGGNGIVAWHRAKYVPKGGPAGGNGGYGGTVLFQADAQLSSLDWFLFHRRLKAEDGRPGGSKHQQGRKGANLTLKVPRGTIIKDAATGELLCDLTSHGQKWVACQGGKGGKGNFSFKSPTNQAPVEWTEGDAGEQRQLTIELKLIADVGLVGFPNAGKSTLLSKLANIDLKVAPYPFTTLSPNLGFIEYDDFARLYIADIPGIIDGAHENRGLGLEFLRHIDRTKCLLYVLDMAAVDGRDPWNDFCCLQQELAAYNPQLLSRPYFIALNKVDVEESCAAIDLFKQNFKASHTHLLELSAQTGQGLAALIEKLYAFASP